MKDKTILPDFRELDTKTKTMYYILLFCIIFNIMMFGKTILQMAIISIILMLIISLIVIYDCYQREKLRIVQERGTKQ